MTRHTLTRLFSKTASPGSWVRDGGTKPTIGSDGPRASVCSVHASHVKTQEVGVFIYHLFSVVFDRRLSDGCVLGCAPAILRLQCSRPGHYTHEHLNVCKLHLDNQGLCQPCANEQVHRMPHESIRRSWSPSSMRGCVHPQPSTTTGALTADGARWGRSPPTSTSRSKTAPAALPRVVLSIHMR